MRQQRFVLAVLAILWCPFVATAQVDFSSIDAFLKSTLKGEDRLDFETKGDLNGDGLEDWAGVIQRKKPEPASTNQLYILLQLRSGGYHIAEKSKEEEIPATGCCGVEVLEIRSASIYIQNNFKDDSITAVTHQFKLYKGEWRLVGMKIYSTDVRSDPPSEIRTDMNLLTGSVIEKRQKGDSKPVTRSRRKRFRIYLLKNFDFSDTFGKR